ncbi:DNA damage-regulated autophagy modulator protein 1-like [Amphiura filiformis]|uniref:DNA damage-regulated autophagy modulator protein 1-like n=1 Tax=Amphiura filiformis TaxID=82378 RepID=UPI003B21A6C5
MFCSGNKPEQKSNSTDKTTSKPAQNDGRIPRRNVHRCSLAWLPICTALLGLLTILVTYTFAVTSEHIFPLLPYISDTGVEYPESSIFSLSLDVVAFLLVSTSYVRYQLIGHFHRKLPSEPRYQRIGRVNAASLLIGVVAAVGLMVLANFPEDENLMVHLMGAFFCFAFGVAYCFLNTWLSFKTSPELTTRWMCFLRLCLTTSAGIMLGLVIVFGTVLRWDSDECNPQMNYRQTSALFEWLLVMTFDLFFFTFASEFHKVRMSTIIKLRIQPRPGEEKKQQLQTKDEKIKKELCCHSNGTTHILPHDHVCSKAAIPV